MPFSSRSRPPLSKCARLTGTGRWRVLFGSRAFRIWIRRIELDRLCLDEFEAIDIDKPKVGDLQVWDDGKRQKS
jgi:hypothetical protein